MSNHFVIKLGIKVLLLKKELSEVFDTSDSLMKM